MSLDLHDVKRLKLTEKTLQWLEWMRRRHPNKSKQDILRETLHQIAAEEIRAAKLLAAMSPDEDHLGTDGDHRGHGGKR